MAQDAVKDLFISDLLPDARRLQPFRERPLLQIETWGEADPADAARTLLLWHFEGELLRRFGALITAIETACRDTVANTKRTAMESARDLLEAKPTGEAQLLACLVNKFGDPDRKVSNRAMHLLQLVLRKHPAMRAVMVREVQQYLHRPGLTGKALYAGVLFLSQVRVCNYMVVSVC
jgi:ribosome biogenesis protein MAK21